MIDVTRYKAVIFDVDGTLYHQRPIRIRMAFLLLMHALRGGLMDALCLSKYRKQRERIADLGLPLSGQYQNCGVPEDTCKDIVAGWMQHRPLPYLMTARYTDVDTVFERLRTHGVMIGVFSDYPATLKLGALGLRADITISADDAGAIKPNPAGLRLFCQKSGLKATECLMIGDRDSRDGEAARRAGMPFLLCRGRNFYTDMLTKL